MEKAIRGTLRTIGGQLAVIVGLTHLGMGTYYVAGIGGAATSGDFRVLFWILAGGVLVAGVAAGTFGWRRRLYLIGGAVTGVLIGAHFLWPAMTGGSLYLDPPPTVGGADLLGYLYAQTLGARPITRILLATELALLVVLVVLVSSKRAP